MKKIINEIAELTMAILKDQESLYGKTIYQIANSNDTSELTKMVKKLYNKYIKVKDNFEVSVFVLVNRLITQMDIAYLPSVISDGELYQENFERFITKCYNLNSIEYKVFIDEVRSEVFKRTMSEKYQSIESKNSFGSFGFDIIDTDNILLTIMTANNYKNHPVRLAIKKAQDDMKFVARIITPSNYSTSCPDGHVAGLKIVNGKVKADLDNRVNFMSRELYILLGKRNNNEFKGNYVLKPVFKTKVPESELTPKNAIDNIIGLIGFNLTKSENYIEEDRNSPISVDPDYLFDYSDKLETIYANGFINMEFRSSRSGKKTTEPIIPNSNVGIFEIWDSYNILDYLATNSSQEKSHPVRATVNGINTGTSNPVLVLRNPPENTNDVLSCFSADNLEGFISKIFLTDKGFKAEVSMCHFSILKTSQNNKDINPVLLPFYRSEEKLEGNVDENSIKTIKSLVGFYIMDKSEVEGL
jgi:hypothetical protein|nr:MAG TPA: hypothetical protein [Caudoviricetes sp.]